MQPTGTGPERTTECGGSVHLLNYVRYAGAVAPFPPAWRRHAKSTPYAAGTSETDGRGPRGCDAGLTRTTGASLGVPLIYATRPGAAGGGVLARFAREG